MITNHEQLTVPLTKEELALADTVLNCLRKHYNGKANAITGGEIVKRMKAKKYDISEPRLRKIMNHLRQLGEPIIGTSSGYHYSTDRLELEKQIVSLEERAGAILAASYGLKKYLNYAK